MLDKLKIRIIGTTELIMHNGHLANPLSPAAKKIKPLADKKKKTDDEYYSLAYAQWEGGLYYDPEIGPYMPTDNLLAMIVSGGRKSSRGKDVQAAVFVKSIDGDSASVPLKYKGPRGLAAMWNNGTGPHVFSKLVKVQSSKIMRTRPVLPVGWSLEFVVEFLNEILNKEDILSFIEDAGNLVGFCDFRPRYGRFTTEVL